MNVLGFECLAFQRGGKRKEGESPQNENTQVCVCETRTCAQHADWGCMLSFLVSAF